MRVDRQVYEKHVREFPAGTVIFKEGDRGNEMYVVISGDVEISKATSSTSSKTLIVLSKGDIFGEMAIIEKKSRSATATAVTDTRLLVLNEVLFDATLGRNPDFARKMIRILSERLRRTNAALQESIITNKQNQVLDGLADYAEESGTPTFKGKRIKLEDFVKWGCGHLGIAEKDIRAILQSFLKKGILEESAAGKDEVLVTSTRTG
jgi:CRP/FNR family cyclic AMP-dependent transcriptional regulator